MISTAQNMGIMRRYASFKTACGGSRHLWIPVFADHVYATACASVTHKTVNDQLHCLLFGSGPIKKLMDAADAALSRTLIANTQTDEYTTGCRSTDRPDEYTRIHQYTPELVGGTASRSQDLLTIARVKSARGIAVREPTISSSLCLDLSSTDR